MKETSIISEINMHNPLQIKYSNILMIVWSKPDKGSRRALEVSNRLGWKLHYSFPRKPLFIPLRYLWCMIDSMSKIRKVRPDLFVLQIGPSIACLIGIWFNFFYNKPVVYDSHSHVYSQRIEKFYRWINKVAFRMSRAVLIHNDVHDNDVRKLGGKPIVLRDPIPKFPDVKYNKNVKLKKPAVFCPLSWHSDEPVKEILETANKLSDFNFYLSGTPHGKFNFPKNVICTGLLAPELYLAYLKTSDVILSLTSREGTVTCAGHEAIAVKRPLVTSDTKALRDRFAGYALFSSSVPEKLALHIVEAYKTKEKIVKNFSIIEKKFEEEWTNNSFFLRVAE